jgi:hypothetical protein
MPCWSSTASRLRNTTRYWPLRADTVRFACGHGPVRVAWPWTTTTKRALCAGCSALSVIALVSVVAGKIRWYSGAAPTTSNKGLDAFVRSWAAQSSLPSPSHARDPQHAQEGGNDET